MSRFVWVFLLLCSCATPSLEKLLLSPDFSRLEEKEKLDTLEALYEQVEYSPERFSRSSRSFYHLTQRLREIYLHSEHPFVRARALMILGKLLGSQGERYYLQALEDTEFIVQYTALRLLHSFGSKGSLKDLFKKLENLLHPVSRQMAAEVLLTLFSSSSLSSEEKNFLIRRCIQLWNQEENPGVQYRIYKILQKLTSQNLPFYLDDWQEWYKKEYLKSS